MAQAKEKLHRLSRVKPRSSIDSVKQAKRSLSEKDRAFDVILQAQQCWNGMYKFREERARNRRYINGDQWKDLICVKGETMTEETFIRKQGQVPLKNNHIRRMVNSVLGVYRQQSTEPICVARDRDEQQLGETMSTVLQYNMQINQMSELNSRMLDEFLGSGLAIYRKSFGWRRDKLDCWTDTPNPDMFFIDANMRDFRGWDVSCLGEIHDITRNTLLERFAKSPADVKRLTDIYAMACDRQALGATYNYFGYNLRNKFDFLVPYDPSLCRVIEVWRKETKRRYRCHDFNNGDTFKIDAEDFEKEVGSVNRDRLQQAAQLGIPEEEVPLIEYEWCIDSYWYYYFLSPFGDILEEGETPYEHGEHPYVFKAYPFIDGEIHSFVSNVIDQQRYINRLITLYDWVMRSSAKGALLIPRDCIPEGMSIDSFAESWSSMDGLIIYEPSKHGNMPQQISSNSTNIGIRELLNLQLKFFEDISGVNGALQGKPGYSGMSAALYSQQTQNATTSLLDILDTFSAFICDGARKDVKNMQQFYDEPRVFNIAGRQAKMVLYDPKKIRDVDFDLSIVPSTSTPAYRAIQNDMLMQMWQQGAISVQQMLECGDFPFADQLLQSINSQQEQLQQGQAPSGISPELMQQAQQGANMQAVQQGQQLLSA